MLYLIFKFIQRKRLKITITKLFPWFIQRLNGDRQIHKDAIVIVTLIYEFI